jgi:hypothetical protein
LSSRYYRIAYIAWKAWSGAALTDIKALDGIDERQGDVEAW